MPTITRFAPSPTGPCHLGSARAALFPFLFAKSTGGKFLLRIEDTDRERSEERWTTELVESLDWLGIRADEVHHQSSRGTIYDAAIERLMKSGAAYECFCSHEEIEAEREAQMARKEAPRYAGHCRDLSDEEKAARRAAGRTPSIRFRVPGGELRWTDGVLGDQRTNLDLLGDFVIRTPDGRALFLLTNAVDDLEMGITHAIRGADHLANTPKQILIFRALGAEPPTFAHTPLLLNPDRSKMSKRDAEQLRIINLRDQGYLPEAVVNFGALLGWNPGDDREIFTLDELSKVFTLERVGSSPAIVDTERLKFFQAKHMWALPMDRKVALVKPFLTAAGITSAPDFMNTDFDQYLGRCLTALGERLVLPSEAPELLKFFFTRPAVDPALFPNAKMKVDLDVAKASLAWLEAELPAAFPGGTLSRDTLLAAIAAAGRKNGEILWPLRVALTGESFSPGAFEVAEVLGLEESLARIRTAWERI